MDIFKNMTNYKAGAIYERKAREILETDKRFNCFWTCRSAGSKSAVDVIGISKTQIYMVQVKSTKKAGKPRLPFKSEIEDLKNLSENPKINALLFIFVRGKLTIYDKNGFELRL